MLNRIAVLVMVTEIETRILFSFHIKTTFSSILMYYKEVKISRREVILVRMRKRWDETKNAIRNEKRGQKIENV